MDSVTHLCLIGFSHRTTPVQMRERYAFKPEDVPACLADLLAERDVSEACVVSTCNRTEVLVAADLDADPTDLVKRRVFRNLDPQHLYVYRGVHAVIHLFRVASGLDSQVLGESEVLAQVKRAYDTAQKSDAIGPLLRSLIPHAIRVGKRVRSETELGRGTLSVARLGVDLGRRVFGTFEGRKALVVGAGETGLLVARHLVDQGIARISFANRTRANAENAAAEFGGSSFALDELPAAVKEADIVVTCIDGDGAVLDKQHFDRRALAQRDRPMLVIDLSMPRAVAKEVRQLRNLFVYDLDDLEPKIEDNLRSRGEASRETSDILVGELHKFLSLRVYASFSPAIEELRRRFENVRDEVLDRVSGDHAEPREVELSHELARRLLDVALGQMKEGARYARSEQALDREYQRFLEGL